MALTDETEWRNVTHAGATATGRISGIAAATGAGAAPAAAHHVVCRYIVRLTSIRIGTMAGLSESKKAEEVLER